MMMEKLLEEIENEKKKLRLKLDWIDYRLTCNTTFVRFRTKKPKEPEPEIEWLFFHKTMEGVSGALRALEWVENKIKGMMSNEIQREED